MSVDLHMLRFLALLLTCSRSPGGRPDRRPSYLALLAPSAFALSAITALKAAPPACPTRIIKSKPVIPKIQIQLKLQTISRATPKIQSYR